MESKNYNNKFANLLKATLYVSAIASCGATATSIVGQNPEIYEAKQTLLKEFGYDYEGPQPNGKIVRCAEIKSHYERKDLEDAIKLEFFKGDFSKMDEVVFFRDRQDIPKRVTCLAGPYEIAEYNAIYGGEIVSKEQAKRITCKQQYQDYLLKCDRQVAGVEIHKCVLTAKVEKADQYRITQEEIKEDCTPNKDMSRADLEKCAHEKKAEYYIKVNEVDKEQLECEEPHVAKNDQCKTNAIEEHEGCMNPGQTIESDNITK
tara:strand:+ start:11823 stop:12605 length:783 start_codon:yes stop_codon:yes gene_type:complete